MGIAPERSRAESASTAADLVTTARERRRMSQRKLARAAAVPQSTVATIESGRRQPSFAMVERLLEAAGFRLEHRLTNTIWPSMLLERHGREVAELLSRYPPAGVWVFGSVARGDDRPDSDLDLLVELRSGFSVVDLLGLEEELAALLGCPVDLVTTGELSSNELLRRGIDRSRLPLTVAA